MEPKFEHNLESEIAELSREIEVKRRQLEAERGIVEERELVSAVVAEKISSSPAAISTEQVSNTIPSTVAGAKTDDYLAALDDHTVTAVNTLISTIPTEGLNKVITKARQFDPLVLDAFHDALVTKLYAELQTRGLIK
jgi:hypothetical protein